jgi:hypothetical protein
MSGQRLVRLRINGEKVVEDETLIRGIGRIRDVQQGRDGLIYLAIDANVRGTDGAPTAILRMVPVPRAEYRFAAFATRIWLPRRDRRINRAPVRPTLPRPLSDSPHFAAVSSLWRSDIRRACERGSPDVSS